MDVNRINSEIIKYRDKEDILKKTAGQIVKDFNHCGIQLTFPDNLKWIYSVFYDQLVRIIRNLMDENRPNLYNLLYRIDISEKTVVKRTEDSLDKMLEEVITELILERELKKVILREHFSGRI
ncbi:MAG: hypothetical protein JXJ22_09860 [Bacteroidales bacterium]|nr:hypothetical protein [Bacteroidales bacterium]